ncbi:MAG TPA: FliI/YscN family ATPase [Mycobacteriales bacterium]|nr:FliI/YscN family ATPase [Mycobacteriales bacterium]
MTSLAEQTRRALAGVPIAEAHGRLRRAVGLTAEASGLRVSLGHRVLVETRDGDVTAEVVGVRDHDVLLSAYGSLDGAVPGAAVRRSPGDMTLTVGEALRGRVVDALGRPIDGRGPVSGETVAFDAQPPAALTRSRIHQPMPLGVRAVDTLLACGRGQRIGILAGSGVGKSTLLGMLARGAEADVVVVGLIGERGREVREFLEDDLGTARENVVAVVATSDEPAMMRLRGAQTATRIAEWYRDQGAHVLLLIDSLTRFAMAAREIGLTAGEPPVSRGYPPSLFTALPRLLERAGPGETGTITGLYTVLVEGDDTVGDPVADHARSILDGHFVLSRSLAQRGHYPTLDVLASVSRLSGKVLTPEQLTLMTDARRDLALAASVRELVDIGAYTPGADAAADNAWRRAPLLDAFLQQSLHETVTAADAWSQLAQVMA